MNHPFFSGMTLVCLASLLPMAAGAQDCDAPLMNCVITRPRPVYTTQLRPQQVTSFCDVTETQMSHRQVVENVPITTCKSVMVDEGGYQMVWVPKPVTKQVSQTVVQQQVKTVAVPVQVRRRVPQVSTQMVPVQTVQYVNETVPVQATAMASRCSSCGGGQSFGTQIFEPQLSYSTTQYQQAPYSAAMIPTMPAIDIPNRQTQAISTPRRESAIPNRTESGSYEETVRARGVPQPQDEATPRPRKTSLFQGVPSAATVWKRQDSYAR